MESEIRTLYGLYPADPGLSCRGCKSPTQQHMADECNINVIVSKMRAGQMPDPRTILTQPMYGDFSRITSMEQALNQIDQAYEQFALLPASVREHFANSPQTLVAWLEDPRNHQQAVHMGILSAPKPPPQPAAPAAAAQSALDVTVRTDATSVPSPTPQH